MLFYYGLIFISIIILLFSIINFYKSFKIEKNIFNYIYIATTSKSYFIGSTIFSLLLFIIVAIQSKPYNLNLKIFSIELFFGSILLLSLSQLFYYYKTKKKLNDIKDFFKNFDADINNRCHMLMIKHITSKEKNLDKIKDIFKRNKHLCEKEN